MSEVLLTAGVAAVFIAVVGGGAKALGFEVPGLVSGRRQLALGILGLVFIGAAVVLQERDKPDGPDPAVQRYSRQVLAACRSLPLLGPGLPAGFSYEKNAYLNGWRTASDSWHNTLFARWNQDDAPDSLSEDIDRAKAATDNLLDALAREMKRLEQELPPRFDVLKGNEAAASVAAALATPMGDFQVAVSPITGDEPCAPRAS